MASANGNQTRGASGIILAGGSSRRMGTDKALLQIEDETLLERTVRQVGDVASEVVVVGPQRGDLRLPVRLISDEQPGEGPLAGLLTGLRATTHDWAIAVAVDLPNLNSDLLAWLVDQRYDAFDAMVPVVGGIVQPLLAVYRQTAITEFERHLGSSSEGRLSITAALRRLNVHYISEDDLTIQGFGAASFTRVNTPEDWRTFLARHVAGQALPDDE